MAKTTQKKLKVEELFKKIDREIVRNDKIITDTIDAKTQARIINQVDEEYTSSFSFNEAKRKINLRRLKLYNNQRKDPKSVGDPLMFTIFNTIHAELYDDRLNAVWEGREDGDDDVEENLNALSAFDYDIMNKSELDYEWNWDAEFFGRGLMLMMEFDRTKGVMAPAPEVIDAVTFIRDPRAKSVNGKGRRKKGAMRFGGNEIGATYWELKGLPGYFNLNALRKEKENQSTMDDAKAARDEAQGRENFRHTKNEESLGKFNNYEFRLLNWFTTIKGKKHLVTLANNRQTIIRLIELNDNDDRWPIIDRALYPMAHDWDGVSIPDITEDKQRGRAILLNIGMASAKGDVTPTYLFDKTRITNVNDLNTRTNKYIGVNGRVDNVVAPLQKATVHQYVNVIMDMLDTSAQRATAATELRSGIVAGGDTTLGEQELATIAGNKRFAMSAKIYGWSEKEFWRQWYRLYKKHFKNEIDEKIVRIQGARAPIFRPLKKDNIISNIDPDVRIESKIIADAKRLREQRSFNASAGVWLQDPENSRRSIFKHMGKLQGLSKEQIEIFFPPTVDELQAEDENVLINMNKLPETKAQDDHPVHLEIHGKANQNLQSLAHMRSHKRMMLIKRDRTDLFPITASPVTGKAEQSTAEESTPTRRTEILNPAT